MDGGVTEPLEGDVCWLTTPSLEPSVELSVRKLAFERRRSSLRLRKLGAMADVAAARVLVSRMPWRRLPGAVAASRPASEDDITANECRLAIPVTYWKGPESRSYCEGRKMTVALAGSPTGCQGQRGECRLRS